MRTARSTTILRPVAVISSFVLDTKCVVLSQRLVKLDVESVDHVIDFSEFRSRILIFDCSWSPFFTVHFTSCSFTSPDEAVDRIRVRELSVSKCRSARISWQGIGIVPGASQQKPVSSRPMIFRPPRLRASKALTLPG